MTDREKIERRLDAAVAMAREGYTVPLCAEVERLIRDAAERAALAGWKTALGVDQGIAGLSCDLPPDFPLVLDAPKEAPK